MKRILDQFNRVKNLENPNFVANTDWEKLSRVDVILIGDNPGKKEKEEGRFFQGGTKAIMDLVISNLNKNHRCVLVMNKSNYYTDNTKGINQILSQEKENSIIIEDIKSNANLVNELGKNAEIVLFGITKNNLHRLFMSNLSDEVKNKIIQLKHPSRHNLAGQLTEYFLNQMNSDNEIPTDILKIFKEISLNKLLNSH